ncbi:type II toxin-antitoxin system RelE/ParE family toxin [archaeon]|nr:type II toxin-antitoxin system RelE/ParE family toxin [archaeon]
MVKITPSKTFVKNIKNVDKFLKDRLEKILKKLVYNPNIGKPLKYKRRERVLYIKPFRLVYSLKGAELILLKFDHRRKVYK